MAEREQQRGDATETGTGAGAATPAPTAATGTAVGGEMERTQTGAEGGGAPTRGAMEQTPPATPSQSPPATPSTVSPRSSTESLLSDASTAATTVASRGVDVRKTASEQSKVVVEEEEEEEEETPSSPEAPRTSYPRPARYRDARQTRPPPPPHAKSAPAKVQTSPSEMVKRGKRLGVNTMAGNVSSPTTMLANTTMMSSPTMTTTTAIPTTPSLSLPRKRFPLSLSPRSPHTRSKSLSSMTTCSSSSFSSSPSSFTPGSASPVFPPPRLRTRPALPLVIPSQPSHSTRVPTPDLTTTPPTPRRPSPTRLYASSVERYWAGSSFPNQNQKLEQDPDVAVPGASRTPSSRTPSPPPRMSVPVPMKTYLQALVGEPGSYNSSPSPISTYSSLSSYPSVSTGYGYSASLYSYPSPSTSPVPSLTSTPRSRSPSVSSLETIPDEGVEKEEEAEREVEELRRVSGAASCSSGLAGMGGIGGLGMGGGGLGGMGMGGQGEKKRRKRWSVCGGEKRADLELETIWEVGVGEGEVGE
ncbi:hypothetical protein EX30DRAFT_348388 [Ascodesmis nigricans]|uniref:Uncharacterized protein n=1 Tax=Ascodesmis nigricans TaxID=341454 RepID=A0A4S2MXU4_9PEZI|nr:hypothetical protein EX30DRAFT_348388 [Ascodesmis nigricans]